MRKIVRLMGPVDEADIENEARPISLFLDNVGHENIVGILGHGHRQAYNLYFVDMDLCDFTLGDYIRSLANGFHLRSCKPIYIEFDL